MSESKYYTPDHEECHVGFEFYFGAEMEKETFYCVSQFGFSFDDMPELAKNSKVKHLDREDIESFEWEKSPMLGTVTGMEGEVYATLNFHKKSGGNIYGLWFDPVRNIMYNMGVICFDYEDPLKYNYAVQVSKFSGEIKNKSEFKRILTQIGAI